VRRYLFTTNHKIVGLQYFWLSLIAVLVGIALSLLMRFHVVSPNAKVGWFEALWPTGASGGVMTPELYLSLMTMHGTIMIFFVLSVTPQSAFGHYFLPLQIGSRRMAFPLLSALSFWFTAAAFLVMLSAFFVPGGAPLSGWTAYPPLSAIGAVTGPGEGLGQTLWIASIGIFCVGAVMGAINFIATVLDLRAPGLRMMQLPLTCWNWLVTAILSLLGFPVLLAAAILLLLDRHAGTSFFVPGSLVVSDRAIAHSGGSPLLWQHLFWFFGHPEVYIAILPGMGLISEIIATFARKPVFGYKVMVGATFAIGFLGLLVWGHHMFTSGMSPYSSIAFSVLSMTIAIPSATKTFNWLATLWGGHIEFTTSMLFALGFVSVFVTGGLSGIFVGQPVLDLYFHDTYFVVAHFHLIMGVAAVFGIFAGVFYWFPRMFGRMLNETLGKIHFFCTFIGVYALFGPMHVAGIAGNPRRYADFTNFTFLSPLLPLHWFMTGAAFFTAAVQLIFLFNLFWSIRNGAQAPPNPWSADTLEWEREREPVEVFE
jgi:cytochrome c oxidase subunit 1